VIERKCFAGCLPCVNRPHCPVNRCPTRTRDGVEPLGDSTCAAKEIKYLDPSTVAGTVGEYCCHPRLHKNRGSKRPAKMSAVNATGAAVRSCRKLPA
jgi:hypothetical protein